MSYAGQWTGDSVGDVLGKICLDLDPFPSDFRGEARFFPNERGVPSSVIPVSISKNSDPDRFKREVHHFNSREGRFLNQTELKELRDGGILLPRDAQIVVEKTLDGSLSVSWTSDVGTSAKSLLSRNDPPELSNIIGRSEVVDWATFRTFIGGLNPRTHLFRGQSRKYSLKTSFHRTNRKSLYRYLDHDVKELERVISSVSGHVYNTQIPNQLGALLNLAQHHGYPTPLLDWTYSPYVAAWFAFSNLGEVESKSAESVRIYVLSMKEFSEIETIPFLTNTIPHTSILETMSFGNPRAIPQQAVLMLSNVCDIEGHIKNLEIQAGVQMLTAVDIPASCKDVAMRELSMMGIDRSTMFPGLDGTCFEIKQRMFG